MTASMMMCVAFSALWGAAGDPAAPVSVSVSGSGAGPAAAPVVAEPEPLPPPREPWRAESALGIGVDTNAARATGSQGAGAANLSAAVAGEPLDGLTLIGTASVLFRSTALPVEANGNLHALWQRALSRDLALVLGSLTRLDRSYVVFVTGARLLEGRARHELGESLDAAVRAQLGLFDVELGGALDLAHVEGAESYGLLGGGPWGALRFIPNANFAARLAYGFQVRSLARLPDVSATGELIPRAGARRLDLHRARLTLRARAGDAFTARLRLDGELIADDRAGTLAGQRQETRADGRLQLDESTALDASLGLAVRRYSERTSTPAVGDLELYVVGSVGFESWFSKNLGLSIRYQVEHASLAPTPFEWTRHLVLVGPSTRMSWGEVDR